MGRSGSRRNVKNKTADQITDVTLNDCANNPRKVFSTRTKLDLKDLGSNKESPDDIVVIESDEDDEEDSGTRNRKVKQKKAAKEEGGIRYPADIWFLIAKYIPPEGLCKFSLICRDAYRVLLSVQFWKELNKRLKNGTNDSVPIHLLSCDNRRGLRMRTIRLAFFKCSALMQSIKPPVAARYEPYTLLGMRLVLTWHEKEGNHWNFFFKWTSESERLMHKESDTNRSQLFENAESGCRVLKAECSRYVSFPYPQHMYLSTVNLGLTSDMRHHKLSLGFSDFTTTHCSARMKNQLGRASVVHQRIDLEPVSRCILMDWWHPEYPHPHEKTSRHHLLPCYSDDDW